MTTDLYRLGFDVLGPIFTTFARLLLAEAERDRVTRLSFVARDGDFLRDVTARLIDRLQLPSPPALEYVQLSRMATILPQYRSFRDAVLAEADGMFGARTMDLDALLRYFGIDASSMTEVLASLDLHPSTPVPSADAILPLLERASFLAAVDAQREQQRRLLEEYLDQTGLLGDARSALVDVGWRGSIPSALAVTFATRFNDAPLRAYYLGYWDERGHRPIPRYVLNGILSDCRRRRTPVEGAAFYAAYIIEALCRAPHGTVTGYRRDERGAVVPVLATDSPQRESERAGERWREPIRSGIYDFIDAHGSTYRRINEQRVLRDAQRRLFRLAFFPTKTEIASVDGLAHTEGHAPEWVRPLVDRERTSPLLAPRRWLAGLASPWRSGYIMATGGRPLATAYAAMEWLLMTFPSARRGARRLALRMARPKRMRESAPPPKAIA